MKWILFTPAILLVGCTQAMMDATMGSSVADDRARAREVFAAIDSHDVNQTAQNKEMHPEVADAIDGLRAEYDAKMEAIEARADAIESTALRHLTAGAKEMAVRFAGMPANMPIWNTIESAVSGQPDPETDWSELLNLAFGSTALAGGVGFGIKKSIENKPSRGDARIAALEAVRDAVNGGRPTPTPIVPGSGTTPT